MKNLQEIIDKKAKDRATTEVSILCNALRANGINELLDNKVQVKVVYKDDQGKEVERSLRDALWSTSSTIPERLIEKLTEKYIPEESAKFLKQVESIQDEINELWNTQGL